MAGTEPKGRTTSWTVRASEQAALPFLIRFASAELLPSGHLSGVAHNFPGPGSWLNEEITCRGMNGAEWNVIAK